MGIGKDIETYYRMSKPKTTEEKKQQEQLRQETLLELATEIHTGKPIQMCDVALIWERVKKLMSVTKITNENAIKYLNKAMVDGGNYYDEPIAVFKWDETQKMILAKTREKCSCCENVVTKWEGQKHYVKSDAENKFESDDGVGTSLIGMRWYVDKKLLIDWEKHKVPNVPSYPLNVKIGVKKFYGKCGNCIEPSMGETNQSGEVMIYQEEIEKYVLEEGMETYDSRSGRTDKDRLKMNEEKRLAELKRVEAIKKAEEIKIEKKLQEENAKIEKDRKWKEHKEHLEELRKKKRIREEMEQKEHVRKMRELKKANK